MKNYKYIANSLVARHTKHGTIRISAKQTGKITSIGTERNYRQIISNYLKWIDDNGIHPDFTANILTLNQYLEERHEWIQQKTLDQERQALQLIYKQKLPYLRSLKKSVYEKRSYKLSEVTSIAALQNERNSITTWLAFFSGIRAHESATILPLLERAASNHRKWDSRRFTGLNSPCLYTVTGKGGLIREIAVPQWLANKLEIRRRPPVQVVDREVIYTSHYDIGFGQAWSQSFSSASKRALGVSHGGHGLRHSYAKWRLQHLITQLEFVHNRLDQYSAEEQSLSVLSQELGHFRLDIVYCYLR